MAVAPVTSDGSERSFMVMVLLEERCVRCQVSSGLSIYLRTKGEARIRRKEECPSLNCYSYESLISYRSYERFVFNE